MSPTEAAALVERVERGDADKAEVAKLCEWWRNQRVSLQMRHDELDAARADLAEALEAMRPFAALDLRGAKGDVIYARNEHPITVQDVARARAILSKHQKPDGGAT